MLGREESERGAARDGRGGGGTALLGSSSGKKKRRRGTRHSTGNKAGGEIADKDVRGVRMAGTWNEDGRRWWRRAARRDSCSAHRRRVKPEVPVF